MPPLAAPIATLLAGCVHAPPTVPILVGDAGRLEGDRVALALVGGWGEASVEERATVLEVGRALLLVGETARGTNRSWAETLPTLGAARLLPLPGEAERRSDRELRTFHTVFDGYGVRGGGAPASWQSFLVVSGGHRWRVVVLDADEAALGQRFVDELSWLPKVLGGDEPVIVLANAAVGSNAQGYGVPPAMQELFAVVRRHVDATRLVMVASAAPRVTELVLPRGAWGEAWLSTWLGEPDVLLRDRDGHALERTLDLALLTSAAAVDDRDVELLDDTVTAWSPRGDAARGWWTLDIEGAELRLTHRTIDGERSAEVRWSVEGGWSARR
ncbi:MAG: hypothetical protein KC621_03080 [Myxococcales bacterium]|nr:hypothetical protein [Myxococcales bacterium]